MGIYIRLTGFLFSLKKQGWVFSWHVITISDLHLCKYHLLPINIVLIFISYKNNCWTCSLRSVHFLNNLGGSIWATSAFDTILEGNNAYEER